MRLATFNLLSGRAPGADHVDEACFRRAIAALDADVLALQEVDRAQPRSAHLDLTAVATAAMGALDYRFVPALAGSPSSWTGARGDEPEAVPAYGIALLSRLPVRRWQVARLPAARGRLPYRSRHDHRLRWVRDEPRVAVSADLEGPTGPLRVVATHLSFLPVSNGRQLRTLMRSLDPDGAPTVLAGDLNMSRRRAERITGLRSLAVGPTFPSPAPVVQLDHLLCRDDLGVLRGGPVALEISDHRALVVDVLPGASPGTPGRGPRGAPRRPPRSSR